MTIRTGLLATAGILGASAASAATLGVDATAYSLGDEGRTLVTVAQTSGAETAVELSFEGDDDVFLDGIDYRPSTGEIYGYDGETDAVYLIDVTTGTATTIVASPGITNDDDLDIDFNPVVDAARVVTGQDENVVFSPSAVTLTAATDLFYVDGDANADEDPNVVFNAYTNAVPDATVTTQYVIDSDLDTLALLGNNTGELTTVGALTLDGEAFDVTENGGFDFLSFSEGDNTAFALLTDDSGNQAIYSLAIVADAFGPVELTFVTAVTTAFGTLDGFTVVPSQIPVPAAGLLLLGGLGGLAALRRRRRAA